MQMCMCQGPRPLDKLSSYHPIGLGPTLYPGCWVRYLYFTLHGFSSLKLVSGHSVVLAPLNRYYYYWHSVARVPVLCNHERVLSRLVKLEESVATESYGSIACCSLYLAGLLLRLELIQTEQ